MQIYNRGSTVHHHLDTLNWPVAGVTVVSWPWLNELWAYVPAPTAVYMIVSAAFMLFQMSDKLGLLHRFKRHAPETPEDRRATSIIKELPDAPQ
jgi:hypothetical protein